LAILDGGLPAGDELDSFLDLVKSAGLADDSAFRAEVMIRLRSADSGEVAAVLSRWPSRSGASLLMQSYLETPLAEGRFSHIAGVIELMEAGSPRRGAAKVLGDGWAITDPQAFSSWYAVQEDEGLKSQAILGLQNALSNLEPEAAVEFYNKVAASDSSSAEVLQGMARVMVSLLVERDVEAAIDWVTREGLNRGLMIGLPSMLTGRLSPMPRSRPGQTMCLSFSVAHHRRGLRML